MNNPLKPTEQITLQAFILALTELDTPFPKGIQQDIHNIGVSLAQKDDTAIDQISKLVRKDESLNQLYQQARLNIQQAYQVQERDKFDIYISVELALDDIAAKLLQAKDFKLIAEQTLQTVQNTSDSFLNLWRNTLSLVKARTDIQKRSILKAIKSKPLTTEDLSYRFDIPKEKTTQLVKKLWDDRKIDTLSGGTLRIIFPQLRKQKELNLNAPLTLTSWGFFQLHPIIFLNN